MWYKKIVKIENIQNDPFKDGIPGFQGFLRWNPEFSLRIVSLCIFLQLEFCYSNKIVLCTLGQNSTYVMQYIAIFKLLKDYWKQLFMSASSSNRHVDAKFELSTFFKWSELTKHFTISSKAVEDVNAYCLWETTAEAT